MSRKFNFSDEQKANIKSAIADLESESSGEIVPYYTYKSDNYEEARWKISLLISLFGAIFLGLASYYWWLPFSITPLEDSIYIIVLMVTGYFIPVFIPAASRFVIKDSTMGERVFDKATTVFLDEEIFKTRDRTGVLIYISELEHEVIVLADAGINKKVSPEDWQVVVQLVVEGIKAKKVDEGIVNAIGACKKLLLDNGFVVRPDDTNELGDELRIN